MYVYIKHSEDLYVVGFYRPDGKFIVESKYDCPEEAARRVSFLNGGVNMDSLADILYGLK